MQLTPSNPAWKHLYSYVARACNIFAASGDVLLWNLYTQETAAMLSHQIDGLWCLISYLLIACSSASQYMRVPISSISHMVIIPSGFLLLYGVFTIASDHFWNHTNGCNFLCY